MNILAIETATDLSSISLYLKDKVVETFKEKKVISQSKILATNIDLIIKNNKIKANDLDAILLSIGPGSYSGLRVSSSFSKGLAFAINKPIYAINTIDAMNHSLKDNDNYYIAIYSHRNYVYYQEYIKGEKKGKQYCSQLNNLKDIKIYGYNLNRISDIKFTDCQPSSLNLINYFFKNKKHLIPKDLIDINPIYLNKS